MTNRFYAGQTNYIEEMNALDGETGDHIADTTGAHAATAISNTPAGNIAATTVQAAINELDTEKLSASATTLPASFTASSLTSVGTLTSLTTTGSVGIGGAAPATTVLRLSKQGTGGTIAFGQDIQTQVQSDVTNSYSSVRSVSSTAAAAFTLSQFNHFSAVQGVLGAGATVTNQMGFEAQSSLTGATNNFGFYSNLASGSGRWNFYAAGTAANYFAGATTFSDTLTVTGQSTFAAGSAAAPSVKVGPGNDGLYSLASGSLGLTASGRIALRLETVASSVNYLTVYGNATGSAPAIFAEGSDTNISFGLYGKGSGGVFAAVRGAVAGWFDNPVSAVNYALITGSATGNAVSVSTGGSDTNRSIAITPAGTGTVNLGVTRVSGADGGIQFGVQGSTRGVRFITSSFGSAIEGVDNTLAASYQPMNIVASVLGVYTVGSNNISFGTNSNVPQMYVSPNATAVNAFVITGGSTGNAVTISTTGTDANRRISVTAGGTEGVMLGNGTNGTVFAAGSYSGAEKALYILNTTAAPTSNPPTGGYLYCEGGALKYRGSAGTVTTIAAA